MPKVAYKPGDLDADVAKAAGPLQVMTYPKGMKFAIEVDLPKEVESDKLLAQELWLGVGAIYKDLVSRIGENLKNTDRGAGQGDARHATDNETLGEVESENAGAVPPHDEQAELVTAAQTRWSSPFQGMSP